VNNPIRSDAKFVLGLDFVSAFAMLNFS